MKEKKKVEEKFSFDRMSYIEVIHENVLGWLCAEDLFLVCEEEKKENQSENIFIDEIEYQRFKIRHRFIPKINFNDENLFPKLSKKSLNRSNENDEVLLELNSLLDCREYVRKSNFYLDRKTITKKSK